MSAPAVAVAPERSPEWVRDAVRAGGAEVAEPSGAEALVWMRPGDVAGLAALLDGEASGVGWVQLPIAGVERFAAAGLFADGRTWTCAKGVYAEPVAEHALALALAGLRQLPERARATSWGKEAGRSLYDGQVTVLGGGGITEALVDLLRPLRAEVTVVRRSSEPFPGAARTVGLDHLHEALAAADAVVLALALTPETTGVIDAAALGAMAPHAWLVNVARGAHVVTDDLVAALADGAVGGAALDVTDPEPLPDGHPLWSAPNCLVTPHVANTSEMARPYLSARITDNVRRFGEGRPLAGLVDPERGY